MKNFEDLAPLKETLKQKIQLKAQRMRRYDKRSKFYQQNNTFKMNKKKFYRELGKTQVYRVQRRSLMKKLNGSNEKKNDV